MAHTCEECGYLCYCDIDDLQFEEVPEDCPHICPDEREGDCEDFEEAPQ